MKITLVVFDMAGTTVDDEVDGDEVERRRQDGRTDRRVEVNPHAGNV